MRNKPITVAKRRIILIKHALVVNSLCLVLFVSATVTGKTHDKKLADTHYSIPKGFTLWQDTGYQGYRPEGVTIQQLMKSRVVRDDSSAETNQPDCFRFSVHIEHAIGSIKRYRILKDECRLRKPVYP